MINQSENFLTGTRGGRQEASHESGTSYQDHQKRAFDNPLILCPSSRAADGRVLDRHRHGRLVGQCLGRCARELSPGLVSLNGKTGYALGLLLAGFRLQVDVLLQDSSNFG